MALTIAGKFGLTATGSSSGAHIHEFAHHGQGDTITVSDPYLLFAGDYKRSGTDLILSKDGREHVVHDYFTGRKHAALASPDGARLSGDIIDALTGHVQYAQAAGGVPDAAKVIGHVTKLTGNATVIRNGVSIVLNMGDNVHKGDVVQSGSNSQLGITFIDGTVFGLASNARMVLNDMVYDPNGSSNSSFLSLVQGTITFLAGETAKHGDMKIDTPVATMGIRGTACLVEIDFDVQVFDPNSAVPRTLPVRFHVLREKDGSIGSYFLYAKDDLTYSNPVATINRVGEVTAYSANGQFTVTQLNQIAPEIKTIIDQTLGLASNPNPQSNPTPGSTPADPVNPGTPKDTSPLKDIPVGVPTPLQIPINIPDPDHPGQTIQETHNVTVTVLKKVEVAPVVDKASFAIADQVKIIDDNPSDVLTPYVANSGKVVSATGPQYMPAGIDLKNFITVDAATGHVSYDLAAFAFLKAGDTAIVTIEFDSSAGSDTFHESLTITINGANDAPVIEHATFAVPEGGTVVLTAANIGIIDPDNASAMLTVSNVIHGKFQTTVNGVTWVDATTFTTADLAAGHVRFVHDGTEAVPTFSIQADDGEPLNHLSETVAGTVDFTRLNDAPVITQASLTIAQGHTVILTTADINFVDPDSPVVTYTVSNLSHGHFEIGSGNDAQATTTFTSADVAAGRVSFVHDGSSGVPTFSLTPNDGIEDGATVAGAVTFSAATYTLISTEGVIINVTLEGATSGFVFPGAGNVTTPGIPEDRIAIGYDVDGSHVVLDNAPLLGVHQMTPISSETHSSGGTTFVSTTLDAGHDVTLVQTLALGSDANFFTTTIDITNNGATDISNLRFLRNFDPDQDVQAHNDYKTFNDVVQNPDGAETFAIVSATGVESHTKVAMVGLGAEWRASVFGFTNTDPYATHAFDAPTDPNGALADLALSLTSSLGTLAAGSHVQVTYITTNNVATEGSNALYGTAGNDFIDGISGDDLLIGLGGADIFAFSRFPGNATILDFTPGTDKILINFAVVPEAGSLNEAGLDAWKATPGAFESVGGDTLIHLDPTQSILLKNVAIGDLHADDFGGHTIDLAPVAIDDSNAITAGGSTILGSVLSNDSDPEFDAISVSNVQSATPQGSTFVAEGVYGELRLSKQGTYFYTLGANLNQGDPVHLAQANALRALGDGVQATEAFTYSISDGMLSDDAVLRIKVTGATPRFALTVNSDTFTGDPAGPTVITGNATILTSGDSLMGAGHDTLSLSGGGNFDLNAIAAYSGIAQVTLANSTSSSASLSLRNGATTDVVTASGSGVSTLNVGGTSVVNNIQGHWGTVNLAGNVTIGSIHGDSGSNTVFVADATAWNPNITIDGAGGSDALIFWGFPNAENEVTIDLRAASLTNIENLVFPGVYNTLIVDADALAGFTTITGFGSRILTYDAALDLTGKTVGELSVQSANADGTTFTVSDKATALHVYGGNGQDTLRALSSTFTPQERDIIFATSSIETIIDSSGTFTTSPDPHVFKLTPGIDTPVLTAANETINGSSVTLNAADNLDGGGGTDTLALYGAGDFNLNTLAGYSGIEQVKVMNFTDSLASVLLRGGTTTDVALAAGGGRSTLNIGDGSIVNSVQGHWSTVSVNGTGAVGSIQGDSADTSFFFGSSASWNPSITIDGGGGSDFLVFWGFINTENDATIDLRAASLANIESLLFPGVNNTLLVDADALAGFTTIIGSAGSKIVTSDLALDLRGKAVTGLSVQSSNLAGTTFGVSDKATAFQVYGGAGSDTLQTSNFAFTSQERTAVFANSSIETIIDQSGTYHSANYNYAPVVTHATLTIAQGHTVTVTTADIDFVDPDDSVVTYTVSNLSHGHFEIGVGNAADVTMTFTSADVAAGLVSFVDDGSSATPTFSLTPNDGSIDGATVAGVVTFSAANYTLTSTEGVIINVTPEGATSGFVFPGAGNVTTPGIPEDRIAIGYDVVGGSHVVLDNAPLLGVHQMASVSSETHSSGGTTFVSTTLDAGHGVTLKQTLALGNDANYFTTTVEIDNNGTADISNLRFLRNFDPDQDVQAHNDYRTFNEVVQNPDGAETFAILSATGVESHTTVAMIGLGAEWRASVFGFTNTDPYALHAFDMPSIPNKTIAQDLSLSLTSSLGTLTHGGGHVEVTYITTSNVATSGSNALFGTAGADTINGLGGDDLLIGLKGADTFVFNAASGGSGHDTIADFTPGVDQISLDYHAFDNEGPNSFSSWLATHAAISGSSDVLIDLNVDGLHPGVDTILLKNVAIASLQASDFHTL